jgi:hypothetical protein
MELSPSRQAASCSATEEHEGSLLWLLEPSTSPYPEPDQSSLHHPILSLKDPFQYYPPTYLYLVVFLVTSFLLGFPYMQSYSSNLSTFPAHLILLDYKLWSSLLCSFLHPPVTSSPFAQNVLLSTLFSNTNSLYSSLNVRDQISHPYRTSGKLKSCIF